MRVLLSLFFLFLWVHPGSAQKVLTKTFPVEIGSLVQLDARNNYRVEVRTENRNNIRVEALMEGEYQGDMLVHMRQEGSTIHIATRSQPAFDFPNDKLSAHKVVAVGLRVLLPEHLAFQLYGLAARVEVYGDYNTLDVSLSSGNCYLDTRVDHAAVKTLSGNIQLWAKEGEVRARSQYGEVSGGGNAELKSKYSINTITGNITIHNEE